MQLAREPSDPRCHKPDVPHSTPGPMSNTTGYKPPLPLPMLPHFVPAAMLQGYEPPTLAAHRDGIVGVFFSSVTMRKAAQVGIQSMMHGVPPVMCKAAQVAPMHCGVHGGLTHDAWVLPHTNCR